MSWTTFVTESKQAPRTVFREQAAGAKPVGEPEMTPLERAMVTVLMDYPEAY